MEAIRHFRGKEIREATHDFDRKQLIEENSCWVLYKGRMPEFKQAIAIKTPATGKDQERYANLVMNEISIVSRINHINFVKLIGVCIEEETLCCVYEYFPSGTLHKNLMSGRMTWRARVKVAREIANALTYLQHSLSEPVIHGDIKPTYIYLDDDGTVKISHFEQARSVRSAEGYISTFAFGTKGYQDPESLVTNKLTLKSDVYSFGVVLVQLLTRKDAIIWKPGSRKWLHEDFISCFTEKLLEHIFDEEVANEDTLSQMEHVATLAARCLNLNSANRPSIVQVATGLDKLKNPKSSFSVRHRTRRSAYENIFRARNGDSGVLKGMKQYFEEEISAGESNGQGNSFDSEETSLSFASVQSSFASSFASTSCLSDSSILTEVSFGGPEVEEKPDRRHLPFTPPPRRRPSNLFQLIPVVKVRAGFLG